MADQELDYVSSRLDWCQVPRRRTPRDPTCTRLSPARNGSMLRLRRRPRVRRRCGSATWPETSSTPIAPARHCSPRPKISEFPVWRSELPAGSGKFLKNGGISVGSARFWYSKVQIRVGLIYITVLLNVRVRWSRRFAARQGRALRLESHIVPAATA